jgi:hypothetical protein
MRCVKQMWKQIFIMLTYANMNMKITWQGYGVKSCLKLVLNKPKEMRGPIFIYIPFRTQFKKTSKKAFMCVLSKKPSWKVSRLKVNYVKLTET